MRKEKLRKFEFVAIGLVVSMMFVCVFSARAFASFAGDIYIRADGSIDPSNAPIATSDNITYVLTADVFGTLTIQRDNIVFDGMGHTFTGSGSGYGITLAGRSNVTVENTACESFSHGIYLDASSGCTLQNNNFTANYYYGIWLYYSSGNTLSDNNASGNSYYGVYLYISSNNTLSNNNATGNSKNGIYLYYSCSNNTLSGNNVNGNSMIGIALYDSSYNVLSGNNVTGNRFGVDLQDSLYNTLSGNNVSLNIQNGITLESDGAKFSDNNTLSGNNVSGNQYGFYLYYDSDNNTLSGNIVTGNANAGIALVYFSNNNTLSGNNVSVNSYGIKLDSSSNNTIYHNNFINNNHQVSLTSSGPNSWDDGYPSGGNYWSNYTGTDIYSGPLQNIPSSDGIGDTPYVIDLNNIDHYPLYAPTPLPQHTLAITVSGFGTTYPVVGNYSYNEWSNVTVTAYLNVGYQFDHWVLDGSNAGSANPLTVYMDVNHTLEATFNPVYHKLVCIIDGMEGCGTVNASMVSYYLENTNVTIVATASKGFTFRHFTLDGIPYSNPITINMTRDKLVDAWFNLFSGNIYIRADGSVDPWNAPVATSDNVTYTLTADVSGTLTIQRDNIVFDGAGHTFTTSGDGFGITLVGRSNVTVKDTTIRNLNGNARGIGIYLNSSSGNTLSGNNVANIWAGIYLDYSSLGNTVSGNNVANTAYGIPVDHSSDNNTVSGNIVTANYNAGIFLRTSSYNVVSDNNVANNGPGIWFQSASGNTLFRNNVTNNYIYGIALVASSSGNTFFHNRLVNNAQQVSSDGSPNTWDNGYPSGGNYWSNYAGTDVYSGPDQNVPGSDGIGDAPYVVDSNNVDHYPLYASIFTPQQLIITVLPSNGGTTDPLPGDCYAYASSVIVSATPNAGYQLSHWMLDGSGVGVANPITVTMDTHHTLQAVFTYTGDIYIRADGSVDPLNAPVTTTNNVTYTLTADVSGTLTIERDNIVFDGAGYTFTGSGSGNGIMLADRSNVTVKDTTIENFNIGICLDSSSGNTLSGNNAADNWADIVLGNSSDSNTLSGNKVTANPCYIGIWLSSSSNNILSGNKVTANNVVGIYLDSSSGNTLSGNNLTYSAYGIALDHYSLGNTLSGNNVAYSNFGIMLDHYSLGNTLSGNNVAYSSYGIFLDHSSNNNILLGNNVANNYVYGIGLSLLSDNNTLSDNIVTANSVAGIYILYSSGNTISHNWFVNNVQQVSSSGSSNAWDNGYPSGGNYWSDYNGTDVYSGPGQNVPGSDGIGDTPYVVDLNNVDHYPLYASTFAPQQLIVTVLPSNEGTTNPLPGNYQAYASPVIVSATPNVGYQFDHWMLDGVGAGTSPSITVTMGGNHTLQAVFVPFAGDIYIMADGSVDPWNAPVATSDNVTYTLTADVSGTLTIERDNIVFDGAGYTFTGVRNRYGITLYGRSNVTVKDTTMENFERGISLAASSGNTLSGNNITNNSFGILLDYSSSGNTVSGNNVADNYWGIVLSDCSDNNIVSGNNVADNQYGILLYACSNNNVLFGNNVTDNYDGVRLDSSSSNTVSGNNVANNDYGIMLDHSYGPSSSGNIIFHNRFVNNGLQVLSDGSLNVWDNGYPSGGNYWSDYAGTDLYDGPLQNLPGSDGIGDTPYTIDGNNRDNYPWMAANYTVPYQITFDQTGVGDDFGGPVITVDGANYNRNGVSFWWKAGSEHTFSYHFLLVVSEDAKRYACMSVSGFSNRQSDNLTINCSGSVTGNYLTQYYLTAVSTYDTPLGEGWYDSGVLANFSVTSPAAGDTGVRYVCTGFTGNASGAGASGSISMSGPATITFSWKTQYYLTVSSAHDTPSGEGWYDSDVLANFSVSSPVAGDTGVQYVCTGFTGDASGSGTSGSIAMSAPATVTFSWKTQYYLTVTSSAGSETPASGWFDTGANITAYVTSPVSGVSGVQYVCTGWIGTGNVPSSGSRATVTFSIVQPSSIIWTWKTRYTLTMAKNFGKISPSVGTHWYDAGSTVNVSATAPSVQNGEQFVWNGWIGSGSGSYNGQDNPAVNEVTMNGPVNETASWTHRYLLIINSNGVPSPYSTSVIMNGVTVGKASDGSPFTLWIIAGTSTGTIGVDTQVSVNSDTRYVFTSWSGGSKANPRSPILMNAPKTVTANYTTQYRVTFSQAGIANDFAGRVVKIDGVSYTQTGLPTSFWWNNGSSHTFQFMSPLKTSSGQYVWASTTGLSTAQSGRITVSSSGNVTANYTKK